MEQPDEERPAELPDGPDAEEAGGTRIEVRDLADGRSLPGFRIRVGNGPDATVVVSDQDGFFTLPSDHGANFAVVDSDWTSVAVKQNDPLVTGVYWVRGWIKVRGVVRAANGDDGFDPTKAKLHVLMDGRSSIEGLLDADARQAAIGHDRWPASPAADGTFSVTLPRIHGIAVAARAEGYKPAHQTLDLSAKPTQADVDLALERAFIVEGVLRSSEGQPLRKVAVTIYTLVKVTPEQMNSQYLRLLMPEGGFTGSIDLVAGTARAKFMNGGVTDGEGRFKIPVTIDGESVLVAYASRHRPVEVDLGVLNRNRDGMELSAERIWTPSYVQILASGKQLPGANAFVCDLDLKDGDVQPGRYARMDEKSRLDTTWLVPGRRYFFDIGGFDGHVVWNGQEKIDVARDLASVSSLPRR